jgi:tRNA G18 (ribose-2'-O)-methylase SpoU
MKKTGGGNLVGFFMKMKKDGRMRGYFAMGVEGISKSANLGNLVRSAHGFGASFAFTVASNINPHEMRLSDTAGSPDHLPFFEYDSVSALKLPDDCSLVGIELLDEAIDLPSFRHPLRAAYVLGPERGSLSPEMVERCDFTIKIPTKFCINVGVAGAIVMYDRMVCLGRFAERPVRAGGVPLPKAAPVFGKPKILTKKK